MRPWIGILVRAIGVFLFRVRGGNRPVRCPAIARCVPGVLGPDKDTRGVRLERNERRGFLDRLCVSARLDQELVERRVGSYLVITLPSAQTPGWRRGEGVIVRLNKNGGRCTGSEDLGLAVLFPRGGGSLFGLALAGLDSKGDYVGSSALQTIFRIDYWGESENRVVYHYHVFQHRRGSHRVIWDTALP